MLCKYVIVLRVTPLGTYVLYFDLQGSSIRLQQSSDT
jgi:hypothetical protein